MWSGPPDLPEPPSRIADIDDHIPAYRSFDHRPYEFIWADRLPDQVQLVDFERLLGWIVDSEPKRVASFRRDDGVQLWDEYVGLLEIDSSLPVDRVTIAPPSPLLVHDPVDSLSLWVHWEEAVAADESMRLELMLTDDDGHRLPVLFESAEMGRGWRLLYRRLPQDWLRQARYPIQFSGIRLVDVPAGPHRVRFDGLTLFMDHIDPLNVANRPARPLPLREGQLLGMNTGPGQLSFPVDEWTLLDPGPGTGYELQMRREGGGRIDVRARHPNGALSFRFHLRDGLTPIEVLWDGEPTGIHVDALYFEPARQGAGRPVVVREEGQMLYIEYARGDAYRIRVTPSALLIDVEFRGRQNAALVTRLRWEGRDIERLYLPFLHQSGDALVPVWFARHAAAPLFAHLMLDPYRSNAAEWTGSSDEAGYAETLRADYHPRTNGQRNDIHERLILAVSPRLRSVLPRTPNPSGVPAGDLFGRVWMDAPAGNPSYARKSAWGAGLGKTGFSNMVYGTSDGIWRNDYESRSYRLQANPYRGGNTQLQDWLRRQSAAGWLTALYQDFIELSPLNAFWRRDDVVRQPDGGWLSVGAGAFRARAPFILEWAGQYAAQLQETFQPPAYWLPLMARHPPWRGTDYDSRAPGAGTFSQVLFATGELFDVLRKETGQPLIASAAAARFYAGLVDAMVIDEAMASQAVVRPYQPAYKLWRLHPLSVFYGPRPDPEMDEAALDAYLADLIAYGLAARLAPKTVSVVHRGRSYFGLRALQARYLMQDIEQILYSDGERYAGVASAWASGVWRESRLYIRYANELEVWVNGSESEDWRVRVADEYYVLPPSGWVAQGSDVLAFSALDEAGHRFDYVESPEYRYLDPRGRTMRWRGMEAGSAVVWVPQSDDRWTVWDLESSGAFAFHTELFDAEVGQVLSWNVKAGAWEQAAWVREGDWWQLTASEPQFQFLIKSADARPDDAL